jgi:hypothetical protein
MVKGRDRILDDASDEEIEQEENRADEEKRGRTIDERAAGRLKRGKKTVRQKFEARLFAQTEGPGARSMAGNPAAQRAVFILGPQIHEVTLAPQKSGAADEEQVSENGQQSK